MSVPVSTEPMGDLEFERRGEPWWRITLRAIDRFAHLLTTSEWAFAALLIFSYAFFLTPVGTNTISRYDMVYALAHGVANIDIHASNTIDVSYFHGHWYSPRSLGLSLLATPMLMVVGHFYDLDNYARLGLNIQIALLNAFTLLPATVISALAFRRFVARLRPSLDGSPLPYVVAGMFALGTLAYPFSTTFYSHMFGGALIFLAFYLLFTARWMQAPQRRIVLAGLLTGVAVISEYPVGVIMLLLGGYILLAFRRRRVQALTLFVAGITPSALLLGWYNWWAFGDPFNLSYAFVSGAQFAGQHTGFFGITVPTLAGLWDVLVYPRGLLVESPFLILVPLGLARWYRSRGPYHLEALMAIAVSIIYPLIVSAYFLPMAGENLPGPRLVTPMLAFTCLSLAWVVDDHRRLAAAFPGGRDGRRRGRLVPLRRAWSADRPHVRRVPHHRSLLAAHQLRHRSGPQWATRPESRSALAASVAHLEPRARGHPTGAVGLRRRQSPALESSRAAREQRATLRRGGARNTRDGASAP